ncbi:hypothetical protein XFPR_12845 [Xylella fastidiosa]|uniref:hypothetical protein n=1 Tax=Xylella fastidiosa TaxID=2371 RepID=UPI0003F6F102|nr:hypothetical protein [Xylella fastidiosa]QPB72918.1 hypothetical protein XFPR_12845 [Xylella fastidiosa]
MLNEQNEVSAVSVVPVTDQRKSCKPSPRIDLLFTGVEEVVNDLVLAKKKFEKLDFRVFDIEMFQERRHISTAILDAEIKLFHLSQDIKSVHIQRLIKAIGYV